MDNLCYELDGHTDVLFSLKTLNTIRSLGTASEIFKWQVLIAQNALQSAIMLHLNGGTSVGVLKPENAKQTLRWFEDLDTEDFIPEGHMENPKKLYKRLLDPKKRIESTFGHKDEAEIINFASSNERAFEKLCNLRDEWTHYKGEVWVVTVSEIEDLVTFAVRLIALIFYHGYAFRHFELEEKAEFEKQLALLASS